MEYGVRGNWVAWVFSVAAAALVYYLVHLPAQPSVAGMSAAQAKDMLYTYAQVYSMYKQSFPDVFELLVTRTVLPIVTLLLGYLFGRQAASSATLWRDGWYFFSSRASIAA